MMFTVKIPGTCDGWILIDTKRAKTPRWDKNGSTLGSKNA